MAFNIHPSTTMVKAPFNGNLNPNEVFATIFNMIISQTFQIPELAHNYDELVNKYKVDGTLYGDTKLFYATDVLSSHEWLGDAEAANLLALDRPDDPKCQAITIDQYRQIRLTTDNYLSKRAWSTEGAFSNFNSVILSMMGQTKKLYENSLFNVYVGTTTASATRSDIEIALSDITATGVEGNRLRAQTIATSIADLLVDMKDYSRDFNDYGFMRAYSDSDLIFIWNSKYINEITKLDEPTIFHKDGLVDKMGQYVLPAKYFGEVNSATITSASNTGSYRSTIEADYATATTATSATHVFPGEKIPAGTAKVTSGRAGAYTLATGILPNESYTVDDDVICKVVTNDTFKFMSAFQTGTNFFNPRSLTENHYLTFGYSSPDRLLDQPLVTVHED